MELNFTGRGAMLNSSEGNTAAYFEDDNNFFLIDCGEDVASKLIDMGKLNQEKNYFLFITHTHSDHIGSIGTLQQYLYWVRGKKLNIVIGSEMKHSKNVLTILDAFGLVPTTYAIISEKELTNISPLFNRIRYVESSHGDTPLKSASIIIETNDGNILYTGDIASPQVIKSFLSANFPDTIDKIYVDTSLYSNPTHLSLMELTEVIPIGLRHKVHCMHLNCPELIEKAIYWGFNVVPPNPYDLFHKNIESLTKSELDILENELKQRLAMIEEIKNSPNLLKVPNKE